MIAQFLFTFLGPFSLYRILQDFLGIIFCTHMLKVLRLPSFKICTFLLGILFFYDIFFVFITPLITKVS